MTPATVYFASSSFGSTSATNPNFVFQRKEARKVRFRGTLRAPKFLTAYDSRHPVRGDSREPGVMHQWNAAGWQEPWPGGVLWVTGTGGVGGVAQGTPVKSKKSSRLGCAASRAVR